MHPLRGWAPPKAQLRNTVVLASFACLLSTACSAPSEPERNRPIQLTIGIPEGDVNAPDVGLRQFQQYLTHEGLNYKGSDGHPEPRLAASWVSSADGLRWDFRLRQGVRFHDGTLVEAKHVAHSLNQALARPGATALRPGLLDVTRIFPAGNDVVTVELKRRSSFVVDDLDMFIEHAGSPERSVGTGPFRVVGRTDTETILEANAGYYLGAPIVNRISLRPYSTLRTAWAALMRGEIDVVSDVAQDAVEFVATDSVNTYSFLRNYLYLIAFNSNRRQFQLPSTRRALNVAIDRQELLKSVLKGRGMPASGPLWPKHWAYDPMVSGYSFDPALAASTLESSGLTVPRTPVPGQLPSRLAFECLVPKNFAVLERLALAVQKQLYDIGVDMQVKAVSAEDYNVRIRKGDFDAVIIDLISGPTFARPYQFWRSPGELRGLNVFGYRSPEADRWLDALRFAADDAALRSAAGQLQRVMRDDPPALFIAWNERTRAVSSRFRVPNEGPRDPLYTLRMWSLNPDWRPSGTTH